ncbi:MAG: hypothetical protein RBJ76_28020 [Stenomitos frigidus ULC029]
MNLVDNGRLESRFQHTNILHAMGGYAQIPSAESISSHTAAIATRKQGFGIQVAAIFK